MSGWVFWIDWVGQAAGSDSDRLTGLIVGLVVLILVALVGYLVIRSLKRRKQELLEDGEAVPEKREAEPPAPVEEDIGDRAPDTEAEPSAEVAEAPPEPELFEIPPPASMREGLAKTKKEGFVARLGSLFRGRQLDDALLEQVEEVLFTSDIGVKTSEKLLARLREGFSSKKVADSEGAWSHLMEASQEILKKAYANDDQPDVAPDKGPEVIMLVGVNGTGKTTTIGKMAARFKTEGRNVLLVAGDTFRAAAVEQLDVWARRVQADLHQGDDQADPSSVVFDGLTRAKRESHDLVIVDTAGRLHTKVNLMEELKKLVRVIGKSVPGAPHQVYLVLDATTGQNGVQQASVFKDAVNITGIVLTKLDGTARGGVVLGICDELGIPIRFVGVGERVQDLRTFEVAEFVDALFSES